MTQKTTNYNLEKYDAKVTAEGLPFVSTTASGK